MPDQLRDDLQSTLGTTYSIERELGGGGMSRVFLADETRFHRRVVIKVLAPELAEGLSAERFEREIALAAGLQQANVVPVLTAGDVGGLPWYSMPYVDGESLRARMDRGSVPRGEAVKILSDVMRALAYAHARGIVHRDIKPENVLLSGGAAVVTDFGIAKAVSASRTKAPGGTHTVVGTSIGTPAYMAPEQAAGDEIDHRADLYSWGVMAYELLGGAHPFAGRTTAAKLMAAHISETPAPLPIAPSPLGATVMHCLAKDPEARPTDAATVLRALDDASISSTQPAGSRRSRGMLVAASVVIALAIAGAVWMWRAKNASPVTDDRLVAVLPFRTASADPSLRYLREGMVDYLAAKLTGSTRVVDPRTALAAWRAAGGTESADLDPAAASKLGAKLGAREVLLGDIAMSEKGVVLHASLIPVNGGDAREATAEGPRDSIPALVDRLAVQLLALRSGESTKALAGLAGTPFPAIRDYLEGQRLSRSGDYPTALESYLAAVRADSNFAAAWYGVLDMTGWTTGGVMGDTASMHLVRLRDRLTPGTRALVDARVGIAWPAINTVAQTKQLAERATEIAPDNVAAWDFLGETFYHWAAGAGMADAHPRAARAFERALALDSSYTSALEHLPELYYEAGDTASARRAIEARLERDSVSASGLEQKYSADVMLGDQVRARGWRHDKTLSVAHLMTLAMFAAGQGFSLASIDSVLAKHLGTGVTDQERATEAFQVATLAFVRGQPTRAERALAGTTDPSSSETVASTRVVNVVFAGGDSAAGVEARARLAVFMKSDTVGRHRYAWFVTGLYDLARGNRDAARTALAKLRTVTPATCSKRNPRECQLMAQMLDAQLAAEEHRPDARDRLLGLDSLLREGVVRSGYVQQAGILIAARLWERAGDARRALETVRRRTSFFGWEFFKPLALKEEGRMADAAGDRAGAIAAYRKYLAMRDGAEPVFANEIAGVKREVARLERMGR